MKFAFWAGKISEAEASRGKGREKTMAGGLGHGDANLGNQERGDRVRHSKNSWATRELGQETSLYTIHIYIIRQKLREN